MDERVCEEGAKEVGREREKGREGGGKVKERKRWTGGFKLGSTSVLVSLSESRSRLQVSILVVVSSSGN